MDPITGGIIAGGLGLAGTFMSNQASSAEAQRMRDFQADMSGSAHQREVQDLRAAGLNPILSALGSGASTPGGAQGSVSDLGSPISKGMDTAIALKTQNKAMQSADADISNKVADTGNKHATMALIENQTAATAKDIEAKALQNRLLSKTIDSQIKKAKSEGDYSEINQIMGLINSGASTANQLLNPLKILSPGKK